MGLTEVTVRIHGPQGSRQHTLLVDTGSSYSWIDSGLLREIGITPIGIQRFKTIDKRLVERPVADVLIEYDGAPRYCPVAFAEKGDVNVLGVTAMEIIGLEIDPSTREIRRITAHAAY
jgi:aspartyl protease family protein